MAITAGTVGPGGAKFGQGAGGPNRYDYTQLGSGLWSVGIDINAPDARAQVDRWLAGLSSAERADVMKAVNRDQPGRGSIDAYVYGADARQRDVARKIQKEHGAFDFLGPLAPVGSILATTAGSVLGGPIGGALAGGLAGGLSSKSVLGGLLGAAGGYFGGGLLNKIGVPTNVLGLPGGGSMSGLLGSFSNAPVTNVNQYMPADIAARAASSGSGGVLAPIVDHSVKVASATPPGVFEATKDLLGAAVSPGSIANSLAQNVAMNAVGSLLGGAPAESAPSGSGLLGAQSSAKAGSLFTQSPYPELMRRRRGTISNQLVM